MVLVTALSLVRVGHPSLAVTRGMVAMWSQFRACGARHGVWRYVASLPVLSQSTRS
jgi:hypothetical protein